jgi:hypothetical protein
MAHGFMRAATKFWLQAMKKTISTNNLLIIILPSLPEVLKPV